MFKYDQTLPGLDQIIKTKEQSGQVRTETRASVNKSNTNEGRWQEQGVQTDPPALTKSSSSSSSSSANSSSSSSSSSSGYSGTKAASRSTPTWPLPTTTQSVGEQVRPTGAGCILLLKTLPPVVNNSELVRQRASAKDCLAAASLAAGASVPLMAGGKLRLSPSSCPHNHPIAAATPGEEAQVTPAPISVPLVPKNTALRAEQRKQNMVSVVRPVVSTAGHQEPSCNPYRATAVGCARHRLEDSAIWNQQQQLAIGQKQGSVLDDFMTLDKQLSYSNSQQIESDDHLLSSLKTMRDPGHYHDQFSEQQARQQAALFRREELELNRSIRKQHRFFLTKLGERKRGLQIVQAVWVQRGFKPAIERLVDIYQQGLIFTSSEVPFGAHDDIDTERRHLFLELETSKRAPLHAPPQQTKPTQSTLSSLNTSLVVDVLSVIILRPKLWNLEICQLLLPIINNDLLMHCKPAYEAYLELGLKSVKLILTHFSSVILTTVDSQRGGAAAKTLTGVDLSREDRINKCLNCCKLLLEARAIIALRQKTCSANGSKFGPVYRELDQLFSTFESSLDSSSTLGRR